MNCEDGVGAPDQLLRIDDARADVGVRPCREQSTRTRVAFHQDIDSTGPQSLHTGGSHGHPRLAGRSLLEGADCDRHIAGLPTLLVLRLAMPRFRVGTVRLFATCGAARVQH